MRPLLPSRTFGLLFLLTLYLHAPPPARAQRPADEPAHTAPDFAHLQPAIAALPDSGRIDQLREFGDVMIAAGRFDQAQAALDEALAVAEAAGSPALISKAEASRGFLALSQEQFPAAINHYQRAYDLIKSTPAYTRQAKLLIRMATVFMDARDWPTAERYLRRALAVAERHQLADQTAVAYGELSNLAGRRRRPAEALAYNTKALGLYEAAHDWSQYHAALINQAICYKNLGQYPESVAALRRVLTYADAQHDADLQNFAYANLPNTLLRLHQPTEAERYAQLGLAASGASPNRRHIRRELYEALTGVKEQQGDFARALAYHRLSVAYADTILNAEKATQLINAETRYQTKEKQARIARLDTENARQIRWLGGLALGAAALAVLLIVSVRQRAVIQRTNAQLRATNQQVLDSSHRIEEQAGRLTMLMKELHHRVKNNLAIVSSLLRLQANRLTDTGALQAVRESQQRVEAMAFIHQRLYLTDQVTTVDMRPYVADLVESLLTAYGHAPADFDVELAVTAAPLDVDLAVPLGLILNELLTNSLKYAYAEVARPHLRIALGADPDSADPTALLLEVADNGPGIAPGRWEAATRSFGHRLITSLGEQVGGRMELHNVGGACYRLRIAAAVGAAVTG